MKRQCFIIIFFLIQRERNRMKTRQKFKRRTIVPKKACGKRRNEICCLLDNYYLLRNENTA